MFFKSHECNSFTSIILYFYAVANYTCTQGQCTLDGTVTTGYPQCSTTILYGTGTPSGSNAACYVRLFYRSLSHEIY